ncbi:MAG: DUF2029 domain-containing protein [Candidatus Dormibacteraeota bacterium]|nr:DUF2029 domain-containing protein [Candidatus Dormibacteraeota bacterium]MBV9525554.1 DUF2029 domain-containing protein [Candidatus Dormibacteraeota bacterium]
MAEAIRRWTGPAAWTAALAVLAYTALHHMLTMPVAAHAWNDTYVYLEAAQRFLAHPAHLYDGALAQLHRATAQNAFLYPPLGILPFLALVPLQHAAGMPLAAGVWTVVDTVALAAAVVLFSRRAGCSWALSGVVLLIAALSLPAQWEINSGQVDGVELLLLALSLRHAERAVSGVWLGLAVAFKPIAVVVLLLPLLRRQPQVAAVACGVALAVNAVWIPFLGLPVASEYLTRVLPFTMFSVVHDPNNISLATRLQDILGGVQVTKRTPAGFAVPHPVDALALLWTIRVLTLAVWARTVTRHGVDDVTALAVTLATVPLLAATLWPHYFLFLLPLGIVLIRSPLVAARIAAWAGLTLTVYRWRSEVLWVSVPVLWCAALAATQGERMSARIATPAHAH